MGRQESWTVATGITLLVGDSHGNRLVKQDSSLVGSDSVCNGHN